MDPVDWFHRLMNEKPEGAIGKGWDPGFWWGRVKQAYGSVAHELRDLRAEHEGTKELLSVTQDLIEGYRENFHEVLNKLYAIRKVCNEGEQGDYDGACDVLIQIDKILGDT